GAVDAGLGGDVGEPGDAVFYAVVAVEDVPDGRDLLRRAVLADALLRVAAVFRAVVFERPEAVVGDVEVEVAVVVEVERGAAGGPGGAVDGALEADRLLGLVDDLQLGDRDRLGAGRDRGHG